MPDPLSIAAMKAFALGRRAKWKDYVDLQLAYHADLSYLEPIEYMPNFAVDDKIIKQKLTEISLT